MNRSWVGNKEDEKKKRFCRAEEIACVKVLTVIQAFEGWKWKINR
jgi:hypothetical protein